MYVGLYGFGYCEAGKNVIQLFKDRGWEAVIADDIVGGVLGMLSLFVGLITCAISILAADQSSWFDEIINTFEGDNTFVFVMTGM